MHWSRKLPERRWADLGSQQWSESQISWSWRYLGKYLLGHTVSLELWSIKLDNFTSHLTSKLYLTWDSSGVKCCGHDWLNLESLVAKRRGRATNTSWLGDFSKQICCWCLVNGFQGLGEWRVVPSKVQYPREAIEKTEARFFQCLLLSEASELSGNNYSTNTARIAERVFYLTMPSSYALLKSTF